MNAERFSPFRDLKNLKQKRGKKLRAWWSGLFARPSNRKILRQINKT